MLPILKSVRGDGDGWVLSDTGGMFWGRHGAAGLLLRAPLPDGTRAVLLQHRAAWSHQGGTWALPGGTLFSLAGLAVLSVAHAYPVLLAGALGAAPLAEPSLAMLFTGLEGIGGATRVQVSPPQRKPSTQPWISRWLASVGVIVEL